MAISVTLKNPHSVVTLAIDLIEKLKQKNKLKFNLEIVYDFNLIDDDGESLRGVYYPDIPNKIFINPDNCESLANANRDHFYFAYTDDPTIFGVTLHEFSHYLIIKLYPTMLDDYIKRFPTERLYLNDYSDVTIEDEMAEILTLYISNPYLLKLISKKHWEFFKEYFISPVPSTAKKFRVFYDSYPQEVKLHMKNKWNIVYNVEKEKFEVLKPIEVC